MQTMSASNAGVTFGAACTWLMLTIQICILNFAFCILNYSTAVRCGAVFPTGL